MKKLSLLVLPILFIATALVLKDARGPYWMGSNYDPDYSYLLNALNLAQGEPVYHIDHPGTTVQLIGAIIIRLLYGIRNPEATDLVSDALLNAELYLNTINWLVILSQAGLLLILGLTAYAVTKRWWLSWLVQSLPFFSTLILMNSLAKVAPEAFLLIASLLLTISCVAWLHPQARSKHWAWGIVFGTIIAFGMVTKLNFLPIGLLPLIILYSWRQKIIYLVTLTCGLLLFTLPLAGNYTALINWVSTLFNSTGIHGSGNGGIIDWSTFFGYLLGFIYKFGSITLGIVFAIVLMIRRAHWQERATRLLIAVVAVIAVGFMLISKQPAAHYFLPFTGLASLLFFLIAYQLNNVHRWLQFGFVGFIMCCYGFTLYNTAAANSVELSTRQGIEQVITALDQNYADYIIVHYFKSSSPVFALKFGSNFAGRLYDDDIRRLYPDFFYYEISNNTFYQVDTPVDSNQLLQLSAGKVVLTGTPFATGYANEPQYLPPFPIYDALGGVYETIYTVN